MKVAYVHIPKTGGGSIKHWWATEIEDKHQLITHAHLDLMGIISVTGQSIDTSFTVVRNTWSRLISAYVFAKSKIEKKSSKDPGNVWLLDSIVQHNQGIIPWLDWMRSQDHVNTRCQVRYSQGVEHIIRDHALEEWHHLQRVLGLDSVPGRTHRVLEYDQNDYLDQPLIDWIGNNYADEIDLFQFTSPRI